MTVVADTLYSMLARKLRGFEECDAPKLYRHFVRTKATISVQQGQVSVVWPRHAHNPILRAVHWDQLPMVLPGLEGAPLAFRFE